MWALLKTIKRTPEKKRACYESYKTVVVML